MENYNILKEAEIEEAEREDIEIEEIEEAERELVKRQEVKTKNKNYWNQIEKFIEDNRNIFFWIILVSGIIIIINQNSNQFNFQYGGKPNEKTAGAKSSSGSMSISASELTGEDGPKKKGKLDKIKKIAESTKGKSYSVTSTDEGVFGAANYAMSFKYQISSLIQIVALTVFLLIVVLPPLSILIIGTLSFIMLKPNLKSLFRL